MPVRGGVKDDSVIYQGSDDQKSPTLYGIALSEERARSGSIQTKVHNIQLVKNQPEERLTVTTKQNFASSPVTGYDEAYVQQRAWTIYPQKWQLKDNNKTGPINHLESAKLTLQKSHMWECTKSVLCEAGHSNHEGDTNTTKYKVEFDRERQKKSRSIFLHPRKK